MKAIILDIDLHDWVLMIVIIFLRNQLSQMVKKVKKVLVGMPLIYSLVKKKKGFSFYLPATYNQDVLALTMSTG